MTNTLSIHQSQEVSELLQKLSHPLSETIDLVRQIILSSNKEISEQVKWNSPSYYFTGEMAPFNPKKYKRDLVVMNLHKKEYILLIFPTGEQIKENISLFETDFKDGRRMIKIANTQYAEAIKERLQQTINEWITITKL